jgi:hypothetical protein
MKPPKPKEPDMPMRASRVAKAAVVTSAVKPGPSPVAKAAVIAKPGPSPVAKAAVVSNRRRRI